VAAGTRAAGSVPTIMDLKTRRAGPRKAIRTGLAVCDSRIHNLLNENRFDINLDGSNTPHRVDKKNKCVWMYEGTAEEMIIPLSYEHDALYSSCVQTHCRWKIGHWVRANTTFVSRSVKCWKYSAKNAKWRSSTSATHQRQQKSSSDKRQHQRARNDTNARQSTS
jgi:hypothetical protein